MAVSAAPPAWWSQAASDGLSVIDPHVTDPNPNGPANIGQAKFMVKRALERLGSADPELSLEISQLLLQPQPNPAGGSFPAVLDFSTPQPVPSGWVEKQQAPLLLGQLKAISAPFYQRLHAWFPEWLAAELTLNQTKDLGDPSCFYPWSSTVTDDANRSIATIGQLKAVFSLRFETIPGAWLDEDLDGIPDAWERANGLDPANWSDSIKDADSDGIQNRYEYLLGFDPQNASTDGVPDATKDRDGDGMPDCWEVSYGAFTWDADLQRNVFERTLDWEDQDDFFDFDSDGLSNLDEYENGTNPIYYDTDHDRMPDGWEVSNGLDPLVSGATSDTDGDGIVDPYEYVLGFDPRNAATGGVSDVAKDRDGDGMPDAWEASFGSFVWDPDQQRYSVQRKLDWDLVDAQMDPDSDGLVNIQEYQKGTNPIDCDTDHDFLPDGWEVSNNLNPTDKTDADGDLDLDGIQNKYEYVLGFDPQHSSTNGIPDATKDRDGDGMPDCWEASFGSFVWDPQLQQDVFRRTLDWELADGGQDMDNDGLSDLAEYQAGTGPINSDTDGDFMPDGWEVSNALDPNELADAEEDPDLDGIDNLHEYILGFNPRTPAAEGLVDTTKDRDGDGMPDAWEASFSSFEWNADLQLDVLLRPLDWEIADGLSDVDADDLSNLEEYEAGTNPLNSDTDGDLLPDGWEVPNELSPNLGSGDDGADGDPDDDGLINLEEFINHTNPHAADTDGDGMDDGWEVAHGLNPNDPDDGGPSDADSDGVSNLDEYLAGTDPMNGGPATNGTGGSNATAANSGDTNNNGIRDSFETQAGVDLGSDQSSQVGQRINYTYDSMGRLTGAAGKTFVPDAEGNLESSN
ncbi:MAG: hypothetical protein ABI073_03210 [Luteolibacter sp.]